MAITIPKQRSVVWPVLASVAGFCVVLSDTCIAQVGAATARERMTTRPVRELRGGVIRAEDADGRVLVDLRKIAPGLKDEATEMVAMDLAGKSVSLDRSVGGTAGLKAGSDQWVVVRPAAVAPRALEKGLQWLPGVCLAPAAAAGGPRQVFSSYADFATVPVVWDTAVDAYRLEGVVGVARDGDPTDVGSIGRTAKIKLSFVGLSSASAGEFEVTSFGIDGERTFSTSFAGADIPNPTLIVRSSLGGEQPYLLEVRPRVVLSPRRNPILGLGLEEVPVAVECIQAHGAPLTLEHDALVVLQASSGRDEDADGLTLTGRSPRVQFRFRSTWLGPARVVATVRTESGAVVGSTVIQQRMPWPQLLAALAGGALGGFARRFVRGARRRSVARRTLEGTITGLVAFLAGVLGVGLFSLPDAIVATVAGAFFTGVLAGFAGVVVLEKLSSGRREPRGS